MLEKEKIKNVNHIIAVASGKGGVGKSTVAVNLALALVKEGKKVGILDADIYGPSQPAMLGTTGKRPTLAGGMLIPVMSHHLQSMSIGYLIDQTAPLVWRGPMIGKAMQQMLHDTKWEKLDFLIVDLPPGTGDIQLTLCQKINVTGAIIVTTPQDLALIDVRRACEMFKKLDVPIIGVVENMSVYQCSHCGNEEKIFGEGAGETLSNEYDLSILGSLPLNRKVRELTDSGNPPVVADPESHYAKAFQLISQSIIKFLPNELKKVEKKFPKIVVEFAKKEGESK